MRFKKKILKINIFAEVRMITINVQFYGQGVVPMNKWLIDHGLVYRRDWSWDSRENGYIYKIFSDKHSKIATLFALKWAG
jgi:hypothetical protein